MKNNILYVCTESAVGMVPYASTIVNTMHTHFPTQIYALCMDEQNLAYKKTFKDQDWVTVFQLPTQRIKRLLFKFRPTLLKKEIDKICQDHDIQIIHFLTIDYVLLSYYKELTKKYTVLYTVHDFIPHESKTVNLKHFLSLRYISKASKYMIKHSGTLITNSKAQLQHIRTKFPTKKVYFHPFPSLLSPSIEKGENVCPELTGRKNYILFFGSIDCYKGVELLYNAFLDSHFSENHTLVIAGRGPIYFKTSTEEKNILWINRFIENNEVKSLFQHASCVVYPYISATQSGVLSIAFRFGTPVITSDIPFFKENIQDQHTGLLFESENTSDLAQKINRLLSEESTALFLHKNEIEAYSNLYAPSTLSTSLEEIYNTI